jgi:hypothetical protein
LLVFRRSRLRRRRMAGLDVSVHPGTAQDAMGWNRAKHDSWKRALPATTWTENPKSAAVISNCQDKGAERQRDVESLQNLHRWQHRRQSSATFADVRCDGVDVAAAAQWAAMKWKRASLTLRAAAATPSLERAALPFDEPSLNGGAMVMAESESLPSSRRRRRMSAAGRSRTAVGLPVVDGRSLFVVATDDGCNERRGDCRWSPGEKDRREAWSGGWFGGRVGQRRQDETRRLEVERKRDGGWWWWRQLDWPQRWW